MARPSQGTSDSVVVSFLFLSFFFLSSFFFLFLFPFLLFFYVKQTRPKRMNCELACMRVACFEKGLLLKDKGREREIVEEKS